MSELRCGGCGVVGYRVHDLRADLSPFACQQFVDVREGTPEPHANLCTCGHLFSDHRTCAECVPGCGTPVPRVEQGELPEAIRSRLAVQSSPCWLWTGGTAKGYGKVQFDGRYRRAHRVVYELLAGPIPEGLDLDHLCRNRACVNPEHLEPVTNRENVLRGESVPGRNAAKTHCIRGHEFTPENTYRTPGRPNERNCRECQRIYRKAYRRKKKAS